jgi:hypothetical protein
MEMINQSLGICWSLIFVDAWRYFTLLLLANMATHFHFTHFFFVPKLAKTGW